MAAVTDMTLGEDSLDIGDVKPWWETIITYGNHLLFAIGFIALIVIDSRDIDAICIPTDLNTTSPYPRDEYVDKGCYYKLNLVQRYPGCSGVIACIVVYMLFTWWKGMPSMKSAFRAVAHARKVLEERKILDEGELREWLDTNESSYARKYFAVHVKLRGNSLLHIYLFAMILRVLCFCAATFFIVENFFTHPMRDFRSFNCTLMFESAVEEFTCASDIRGRGLSFGILCFVICVIMVLCACYGVWVAVHCYRYRPEGNGLGERGNLEFLKRFTGSALAPSVAVAFMDVVADTEDDTH